MNQIKTGELLRKLRKEKGLTQEQLAEHIGVSRRTISRWETGNNMPDLSVLIEIADFYDVDIREIFDGERKSEIMNCDTKDTLKKAAEYTAIENKRLRNRMAGIMGASAILLVFCFLLFETHGFNGFIIESAFRNIMSFTLGLTTSVLILNILFLSGAFDKISARKLAYFNQKKNNTPNDK